MSAFLTPVLLTVGIAAVASIMLALASKFFAVPVDEQQIAIRECLSGANCGACGYAGCDDYAKALADDPTVPSNLCAPGGDQAATKIAAILGQEAMDVIEKVAVIHCSGINDVTKQEMQYQGLKSCAAAKGFFGGPGECKYGCIGRPQHMHRLRYLRKDLSPAPDRDRSSEVKSSCRMLFLR